MGLYLNGKQPLLILFSLMKLQRSSGKADAQTEALSKSVDSGNTSTENILLADASFHYSNIDATIGIHSMIKLFLIRFY